MKKKAVIFDFGNVIAFFDYGRVGKNLAALSSAEFTTDEIKERIHAGDFLKSFETGKLSIEDFLKEVRRRFALTEASDHDIIVAWCDIFTPNRAVIEAIKKIPASITLVLGSTTNPLHFEFYRREFAEALNSFSSLVVSHEVGVIKPDALFYQRCLEEAHCRPQECLYVDDIPDYIAAAGKLGIEGIVYDSSVNIEAKLIKYSII